MNMEIATFQTTEDIVPYTGTNIYKVKEAKKKTHRYTKDDLKLALTGVISGELQQSVACKMYNIPRSSITCMLRKQGLYAGDMRKFPQTQISAVVDEIIKKRSSSLHITKQVSNQDTTEWDGNEAGNNSDQSSHSIEENSINEQFDVKIEGQSDFSSASCQPNKCKPTVTKKQIVLLACGSFNPITNMHLRMFEIAKDHIDEHFDGLEVEKGIISPVSDGYKKQGLLGSSHRINMCTLAVQDNPLLTVSTWEALQENWTPTIKVLEHHQEELNRNTPKSKHKAVMLLCGGDFFETFTKPGLWLDKDITTVLGQYGIVVISRSGSHPKKLIHENDLIHSYRKNIHLVKNWMHNEISSTEVRRAIRRNKSIRYLVPNSVMLYIDQFNLYKGYSENLYKNSELAPYLVNKL